MPLFKVWVGGIPKGQNLDFVIYGWLIHLPFINYTKDQFLEPSLQAGSILAKITAFNDQFSVEITMYNSETLYTM